MSDNFYSICNEKKQEEIDIRNQLTIQYVDYPIKLTRNLNFGNILNSICCYGKGLPHDNEGFVLGSASVQLYSTIYSRNGDYTKIPNGGRMRQVSPSAIESYELLCGPKCIYDLQDVPKLDDPRCISEMIEVYWMEQMRDIPFSKWNANICKEAIDDLNACSNFLGPKIDGKVTINTLFRGSSKGDLIGPYVSQFLFLPVTYGIQKFDQKYEFYNQKNYLSTFDQIKTALNGSPQMEKIGTLPARYMYTLRDGAAYAHKDEPAQAFENAFRILSTMGLQKKLGPQNEANFVNFGMVDIIDLLHRVTHIAALACWFYKWTCLKLRPEEYGFLLAKSESRNSVGFLVSDEWKKSIIRSKLLRKKGNTLLSTTYPEGSPLHPSYPSGHATFSGACATILKAYFQCDVEIPAYTTDGKKLIPLGYKLLVSDELDKLASNIGTFRNAAGIHYRSDMEEGILLGEQVAIQFLKDHIKRTPGYKLSLPKRNGEIITIE